jgi:hypothetical protein
MVGAAHVCGGAYLSLASFPPGCADHVTLIPQSADLPKCQLRLARFQSLLFII